MPPEIRIAERTGDLTAYQEGEVAVLRWSYPSMTTAGKTLAERRGHRGVAGNPAQGPGAAAAHDPPGPRAATPAARGAGRDHAAARSTGDRGGDPRSFPGLPRRSRHTGGRKSSSIPRPPWCGTACGRSAVANGSPNSRTWCGSCPRGHPTRRSGVELAAGAQGIDVRWEPVPRISVLVERSPDGTLWTSVTEQAVTGGEWRDDQADQGRAWSYRLRSVASLEGGGQVIGDPSEPVRIEHPDTYPPPIPEEVVCLPEGETVRVRWRLVPGAANYEVARRFGGKPSGGACFGSNIGRVHRPRASAWKYHLSRGGSRRSRQHQRLRRVFGGDGGRTMRSGLFKVEGAGNDFLLGIGDWADRLDGRSRVGATTLRPPPWRRR